MMALGKNRDTVNMCLCKRAGKLCGIELRADIGDVRAGMEIQMNLASMRV